MYQSGLAVADSPNGFAAQLISLFTTSIGDFAYPIISLVVVVVMVSSLLAVVDACPRVIGALISYRKQAGAEQAGRTAQRRFGELMGQETALRAACHHPVQRRPGVTHAVCKLLQGIRRFCHQHRLCYRAVDSILESPRHVFNRSPAGASPR